VATACGAPGSTVGIGHESSPCSERPCTSGTTGNAIRLSSMRKSSRRDGRPEAACSMPPRTSRIGIAGCDEEQEQRKSLEATSDGGCWRRGSESNRRRRLCRPLHDHSATPPWGARAPWRRAPQTKRESQVSGSPSKSWSGKGVSNSRPQPWQGCALPTELFPHRTALNYSGKILTVKTRWRPAG
jgi:hypothetical protein